MFALLVTALSFGSTTRAIDGEIVDLEQPGVRVYWSLDDAGSHQVLRRVAAMADCGIDVVAVNVDGAQRRAELRPFLRRMDLDLVVVQGVAPAVAEIGESLWVVTGGGEKDRRVALADLDTEVGVCVPLLAIAALGATESP